MRKFFSILLAAVALTMSPIEALAQQYQTLPPNSLVANSSSQTNPSHALSFSELEKILNLYSLTRVGNTDYTMSNKDRVVATDSTASWDIHTWTLPRAVDFNPGQPLYVADLGSKITGAKPLTIVMDLNDRINGSNSPIVLNSANSAYVFISDGYGNWLAQALTSSSVIPAATLLANPAGSAAVPTPVSLDTTFQFSGSALQIAPSSVANSKLASMVDGTIKSNISGSAAGPADNSISAVLDKLLGTTQGSVIYRDASTWAALSPGSSGQLLSSGGAGANPSWITASGTGTVTSITCFGSAITTTGTCATAATKADQQTATSTTAVVTPSQQQSHPSAAKAWVRFTGASGAISQAYNVASVTRSLAGSYTLNFSTAFANTNYTCVGAIEDSSSNGIVKGASSGRSGSANPIFAVNLAGTAYDPATVEVACFGAQ
ncbi:hypothetical protein [Bradyrhizobium sp. STM 3566]|uniref:hypothetical protein n=1 Tax=Bradyrhizobium sp. STM 3566 TaxID=578928 RepID=UPI00388DEB08